MDDLLDQIQVLQFSDRAAAEMLLMDFIRQTFPQLTVRALTLRPLAVSLNSFNGFLLTENEEKLFFKTHIETDGVLGEYYHAEQLASAGYPILQPILQSHQAGKQLVIYPYVDSPSVFDIAWKIEQGDIQEAEMLAAAQHRLDDQTFHIYRSSLEWQDPKQAEAQPVHQLFHHRLTGGRLDRFYNQPNAALDVNAIPVPMSELRQKHWRINGSVFYDTLDSIIRRATKLLMPSQPGASIVGHGDAHNGNVFFHRQPDGASLSFFDPAFAGRHHPLLDLTKPLFHNVFCMWMYYPSVMQESLRLDVRIAGDTIIVDHDYRLHDVRMMFLRSKTERVLIPTLRELKLRGWLPHDWRAYLKASLFCCPFLTRNLLDAQTFSPEIALLGLTQAVEMGAESHEKQSLIDSTLDEVEQSIL
jgi:hypothetical protein